jgi:hypothetical protein
MKLFFTITVISATLGSFHLDAQSRNDRFKIVTITNEDRSTYRVEIDARQLLQSGKVTCRDSVFQKPALAAIYSIQVDSSVYFLRSIKNRADSVAVLNRAIEGKVSVYTPPLESGLETVFMEKDSSTYEMRQKVKESNGKKFYQNEFKGLLLVFFSDCQDITKAMINKVPFSERSFMEIASRYNKSCGWEKTNRTNEYKAKFQIGLELEGTHYNSTKGIAVNYFEGDRPASGFGFGLYARLDFARKKSAFLISELTYNHITGGGDIDYYVNYPTYQIFTEHHKFDITELRNTYSAYFYLARFGKSSLAAGGGILFQYQLKNNSTVNVAPSVTSKDKFGLSPIINILYNMKRMGVGYQVVLIATQLKGTEGPHTEHRVFVQARLSK